MTGSDLGNGPHQTGFEIIWDAPAIHEMLDVVQLEGGKRLKRELMPGALHPSGKGMQALAECIHDSLQLAIPNLPVTKS